MVLAVAACSLQSAHADGLKDLLGKLGGSSDLGNVINNVLGSSTLSLSDLEGDWKTTGPALVFKSDDLLEKAGGAAASATIEKKLDTYYDKLGLDGTELKLDSEGNATLVIKGKSIPATVTDNGDGSFKFAFGKQALSSKLGSFTSMTVYFQKSGNTMSITADAKKLVDIAAKVASKTEQSTLSTISSLVEKYDQICIGFHMQK